MMNFLHEYGWWLFPSVFWFFSLAVSSLPALPQNAGFLATWLYRLGHALSANGKQFLNSFGVNGSSKENRDAKTRA